MNKLYFNLERDFNTNIVLIANNEVDLENHLISLGYTNISFSDTRHDYGTCSLKDIYGSYTAKCYYVKCV
jgi:hypothetical protein